VRPYRYVGLKCASRVIAAEIAENLQAALEQFSAIFEELGED